MNRNFIRLAAANTKIKLLDIKSNTQNIIKHIEYAYKNNIDVLSFPELSFTGVSSGEMLSSREIINKSKLALKDISDATKDKEILVSVGLPFEVSGFYLSCQALIFNGEILSLIAKNSLSKEEKTYLASSLQVSDDQISSGVIIESSDKRARISFIFEEDLYKLQSSYADLLTSKVNVVFVLGSRPVDAYSLDMQKEILKNLSKKDNIALAYCGPSSNESSTNGVYSGQKFIIEDGTILEESKPFTDGMIYTDINLDQVKNNSEAYYPLASLIHEVDFKQESYPLVRKLSPHPMVPSKPEEFASKAKNILNIQAHALIRRLNQLADKKVFLGLSGGLDSTHALIVACYAFEKMSWDKKDIHAIIMPGLGTSSRTKSNAHKLAEAYGVTVQEISINDSVIQHFKDLEHDINDHSIVFENAQARERTQILMDLSNKHGGMVLGTGNMSEIALGFATYNGDHMSMYAINSGLTKILLRAVVRFVKDQSPDPLIKEPLADILDTPISPELLPAVEDKIVQKTEDNVGPYELHDFFLYHTIRNKSAFEDVVFMADIAFEKKYSLDEIKKWYTLFLRRFSIQQFKRSCMPDGPAIEDFSLNPRNGFTMASDIEILKLEEK